MPSSTPGYGFEAADDGGESDSGSVSAASMGGFEGLLNDEEETEYQNLIAVPSKKKGSASVYVLTSR